jgi:hypothetical protein
MSSEMLREQPEQHLHKHQAAYTPQRSLHPWAQAFGKPGERVIREGNGWSIRAIHFPNGPAVVAAEGPLAEEWQEEQQRLIRFGFRPEQVTALMVLKSYQHAEGDCAERERQQRRLAYVHYLVESGRLSDGVIPSQPVIKETSHAH